MKTYQRIAVTAFVSIGVATCKDSPTGTSQNTQPESVRIEAPTVVAEGADFTVKVTVFGSSTTSPLTSFSGTVALAVSAGAIQPAKVTVSSGVGSVQARITGGQGEVNVTASLATLSQSHTLLVAAELLPGAESAPASTAIPRRRFEVRPEDYSETHPHFTGRPFSFNTLVLVFRAGTTVGEANRVLARAAARIVGGITGRGSISGILQLRLPTTTHQEMEAALAKLGQEPSVEVAVQDALEEPLRISEANNGSPDWQWDVQPAGGNWGLELTRIPQIWNLHAGVVAYGDATVVTGVLDAGFEQDGLGGHEDLRYAANLSPGIRHSHGTHVAGTIGATFNNGEGVDGANPFAQLIVMKSAHNLDSFYDLMKSQPDVQVINYSMGSYWATVTEPGQVALDANTDQALQLKVNQRGSAFHTMLTLAENEFGRVPLIVAAAGNDSNTPLGTQPAMYVSPAANAGLRLNAQNILVIENVSLSPGPLGNATRRPSSNVGGHLSAPGTDIWSADTLPVNYSSKSGTSMAAPLVSGLAGYLLAVDPTLTNIQLRDVLLNNTIAVAGGASPRVDGFAALMDIDRVRGNDRVLRMLLDIDDGTEDGNRRTDPESPQTDYVTEASAADCDVLAVCRVDMADFRRFRDALLQLENPADLALDGNDPDHLKKDLNTDLFVSAAPDENVYPRADFNGDGIISRTATAGVPGFAGEVTDLEVFQKHFDDHHYQKENLTDLRSSADIAIRPASLLSDGDVVDIHSSLRPAGTASADNDPRFRRIHMGNAQDGNGLWQVYTVPVAAAGYTARVMGINLQGDTIFDVERHFSAKPGQDHFWDPPNGGITLDLVKGYGPGVEAGIGGLSCSKNWDIFEGPVSPALTFENSSTCSASGVDSNTGAVITAAITGSTSYTVVTSTGTTAGNLTSVQLKADLTGHAQSGAPGEQGDAGSRGRLEMCFAVAAGVSRGWQISGSVQAGDRGVTIVELSGTGGGLQRIDGVNQAISLSGRLGQGSYCMELYYEMNLETSVEVPSLQQALHSIATLTFVP